MRARFRRGDKLVARISLTFYVEARNIEVAICQLIEFQKTEFPTKKNIEEYIRDNFYALGDHAEDMECFGHYQKAKEISRGLYPDFYDDLR
jgi:tRNA U55 pseudouridine synthase TruB